MVNRTSGYYQQKDWPEEHPRLYYTLYEPEGKNAKATLLLLHGMESHSGRFEELAQYFAKQGISVLTYDHLGHGKTANSKEDLGFFRERKPADRAVEDAIDMADFLNQQYPDVPHFILGHSMGSFITRCVLQNAGRNFSGAVIVGTGGKTPGVRIAKAFFSLMNWIKPKRRNQLAQNIFNMVINKKFRNERGADSTSWLSASKSNRKAYKEDDLTGVTFTNNGFYTLIALNVQVTKRRWAKDIPVDFPLLFASGLADPILELGQGVRKTVENLQNDGFRDVTLKLYQGMRHEVLNEDNKEQVYWDILNWINNRLD